MHSPCRFCDLESPLYCRASGFAIRASRAAGSPSRPPPLFSRNFRASTRSIILPSRGGTDPHRLTRYVSLDPMNLEPELLRRLRAAPEIFGGSPPGPDASWPSRNASPISPRTWFAERSHWSSCGGGRRQVFAGRPFVVRSRRLEQSTAESVACHKAQRFGGRGRVWDFCCGIGGDAIQLAARGEVIAVDRNPAAGLCTQWNAETYGGAEQLTVLWPTRKQSAIATASCTSIRIAVPARPGGGVQASGRRTLKLEEGRRTSRRSFASPPNSAEAQSSAVRRPISAANSPRRRSSW